MKTGAIILGAGKGSRMNSKLPKILHCIFDKPLIKYVIESVETIIDEKPIVVLNNEFELVKKCLKESVNYAFQKKPLGTGDAFKVGFKNLKNEELIFVLCGDTPLLTKKTLLMMKKKHILENKNVTVLSATVENSFDYGRICRDKLGSFLKIVEEKDATNYEKKIKEINSGVYLFSKKIVEKYLHLIGNNNIKKEFYLTDILRIIKEKEGKVDIFNLTNSEEIKGINTRVDLAEAKKIFQKNINKQWMIKGVTLENPETIYIGTQVILGKDVVIGANVHLIGKTSIEENSKIGNNTTIENSIIKKDTIIKESVILNSIIGERCLIGPFSYIRPNCHIKNDVKIGDFVELKKTKVDNNSKIPHHSYVGDALISKNVNIGAGTITCNYDGKNKYQTTIEEGVFVGSNTNLVAPVIIGKEAYIAAGSTIIKNVPAKSLAIARSFQKNIENWGKKNKKGD